MIHHLIKRLILGNRIERRASLAWQGPGDTQVTGKSRLRNKLWIGSAHNAWGTMPHHVYDAHSVREGRTNGTILQNPCWRVLKQHCHQFQLTTVPYSARKKMRLN